MQIIEARALIFDAEDKPATGLTVTLEVFSLAGPGWKALSRGATDDKGAVTLRSGAEAVGGQGGDHVYAPALRLTEAGDPAPRVLAEGGLFSVSAMRGRRVVTVDFGEIERLEENAFALQNSQSQPTQGEHVVAGLPRRQEINMALLTRSLAAGGGMNRAISANIGRAIATGTVTGGAATPSGGAAAARPELRAEAAARPELSVSIDRLNAELLRFAAREAELRADISAKDVRLTEAQTRIVGLERSVSETAARLAAAERAKQQAEEVAKALRDAASREAPIQSIAASIGKEAKAANETMERDNAGFRIGKMQVTLRGALAPDGNRIALANVAEMSRAAEIGRIFQDVSFDLTPDRRPPAPPPGTPAPDVLGMTESAARRALAAAGLGMSVASRPGGAGGRFSVGQAIQQAPAAGQPVALGEPVIVVFAAP